MESLDYKKSKTTELFEKINVIWYLASLPDFWIAEVDLPKLFKNVYDRYIKLSNYIMIIFSLMSAGAFLTQQEVTPKQQQNMVIGISSCMTTIYRLIHCYYKSDIKKIIYYLTVYLKDFNKEEVDLKMIRKIKFYAHLFIWASIGSMFSIGISGVLQVCNGGLFVTFITIWPDVNDPSQVAEIARYVIYLMWYIILLQAMGTILMVMIIMLLLSHQYENLTSYFYELEGIFTDKNKSQEEKEKEYEEALIKGIEWHIITLWCVERCQYVFRIVFNLQMSYAPLILTFILPVLLDPDVDTKVKAEQVLSMIATFVSLGFFMWPAGDITVEASKLPEGLYGSGWEHCYGRNGVRLRKMIIIAMQQAQQPVILKAFNIFQLSYKSYVTASMLPEGLYGSGWEHCYGRNGVRLRKMIIIAMQQAQQPVILKAFNIFQLSYKSYVTIVKASYSLFCVLAM